MNRWLRTAGSKPGSEARLTALTELATAEACIVDTFRGSVTD